MTTSVIVAGARTPIGRLMGSLKDFSGTDLGAIAIRGALEKADVPASMVQYVIMGQVLTAGAGQITARQAAIKAGLPHAVPAMTLNKVCGSGLKALHLGAQAIRCGDADVIIAGGMENMSQAPYVMPAARTGQRMGHGKLIDSMIQDGLWDAFNDYHMGITAENLVDKYGISREEQDAFAAASQQKAVAANRVEDQEQALQSARLGGHDYLVLPTLLHWEDRATEWNFMRDKVQVRIEVVDVFSGQVADSAVVEGKSGIVTLGGDHPQDLLPEPIDDYLQSLLKP